MQNETLFSDLPAHARLWIYTTDQPLAPETEALVSAQLMQFMNAWQSHGRKVLGDFLIHEHRFILISADIPDAEISGCGIDASVHALEEAGKRHGFSLLSGLSVLFRDEQGQITSVPRGAFRKMVRSEEVTGDTTVFDTSLVLLQDVRDGKFELPARSSWHATVFRIPAPTT